MIRPSMLSYYIFFLLLSVAWFSWINNSIGHIILHNVGLLLLQVQDGNILF